MILDAVTVYNSVLLPGLQKVIHTVVPPVIQAGVLIE